MYTALVAQQEGEYRYVNSRLLTNAQGILKNGGLSAVYGEGTHVACIDICYFAGGGRFRMKLSTRCV